MYIEYTRRSGQSEAQALKGATKLAKDITTFTRLTEVRDVSGKTEEIVADLLDMRPEVIVFVGVQDRSKAALIINEYKQTRDVVALYVKL